jgi:hypothetical protein
VPRWIDPLAFDPAWTTPAELHGDGSVTAKGMIPKELFVAFVCSRRHLSYVGQGAAPGRPSRSMATRYR